MKLILAIVNDEDAYSVIMELNRNRLNATKLSSTGGFLKAGNTSLLVGVSEDKVDLVLKIIREKSRSRKKYAQAVMMPPSTDGSDVIKPAEVTVGGATIFILDVERFEKF